MSKTKIPWAEEVWNPLRGCSRISTGCENCYAEKMAGRFCGKDKHGKNLPFAGFAHKVNGNARWTGKVTLIEHKLMEPLKNKKPTVYFVNSMSDVFHNVMEDEWIDQIFAVMALCPQHTFIILTKRAERMQRYVSRTDEEYRELSKYESPVSEPDDTEIVIYQKAKELADEWIADERNLTEQQINIAYSGNRGHTPWPLPNLILGVSVENQETAEERIPWLLQAPAAKRIVSLEPLLEEVDLTRLKMKEDRFINAFTLDYYSDDMIIAGPPSNYGPLDGVIAGGESGPKARPAHSEWFKGLRDQCAAAGVPFFFKQWGEYRIWKEIANGYSNRTPQRESWKGGFLGEMVEPKNPEWAGVFLIKDTSGVGFVRVGNKAAGNMLDGKEHKDLCWEWDHS